MCITYSAVCWTEYIQLQTLKLDALSTTLELEFFAQDLSESVYLYRVLITVSDIS